VIVVEAEPSQQYSITLWQMVAEEQYDTMLSDMEEQMKQNHGTEFLHMEKMESTDIHQCLQNIYGDHTVNVSTVR